ncbi:hypothetical protein AOLI_G00145470 [Acnodon oligacanthus]
MKRKVLQDGGEADPGAEMKTNDRDELVERRRASTRSIATKGEAEDGKQSNQGEREPEAARKNERAAKAEGDGTGGSGERNEDEDGVCRESEGTGEGEKKTEKETDDKHEKGELDGRPSEKDGERAQGTRKKI